MPQTKPDRYKVQPFPKARRFTIDAGHLGRRRHIVHGLLEMDVTEARLKMAEIKQNKGEKISLTAYMVGCLAKAVARYPQVQATRDWRGRLVIYDHVNINTMVEAEKEGRLVPIPHIIKYADKKSFRQIHEEIQTVKADPQQTLESTFMDWFLILPGFMRRIFYRVIMGMPKYFRKYSSSVLVTAVGMFGKGGGWGIPMANFSLTVTLGGLSQKPGVADGRIEIREFLDVTLSFDHDIIDGAPAARFTHRFRKLVEDGWGIENF